MTQTNESTGSIQEIDFRFHEFLYTLSNHQRLIDVLRGLRAQIRGFIRVNQAYSLPDELAREHRAIINALRLRDPVTIRTVVEDHIVNAGRRVEANLPKSQKLLNHMNPLQSTIVHHRLNRVNRAWIVIF